MKCWLLIIFVLFIKGVANGQASVTDDKIAAKIADLKSKDVSKFVVYNVSCSGDIPKIVIEGECTAYDIKYVEWLENEKSYLQRFDECNEYSPKSVNSDFFYTISKRWNEINKAKILWPRFKVMYNGKLVLMDMMSDHTCSSVFKIYWGDKFIEKHVNQYYLSFKYSDKQQLNVNYLKNQKNVLNELYKQVIKEIAKTDNSSKSTSLHH
jgi:hypothetical protein